MADRFDIDKDGRNALPLQRVRSGYEREGWDNGFVSEPARPSCDLQCDGPVAHRNAMLDPHEVGNRLLEELNEFAIVRQPSTRKDVAHTIIKATASRDVRVADVKLAVECGTPAKKCELLDPTHFLSTQG